MAKTAPTPTNHVPALDAQRILQLTGISVFFGWTPFILMRCFNATSALTSAECIGLITFAIGAAYLAADFFSGFVHWLADNYGSENWLLVGPGFIQPFREHHVHPKEIGEHDFVRLNGNTCLTALLALWWATLPAYTPGNAESVVFFGIFWTGVAWLTMGTNQFHRWAHTEPDHKIIQWLQRNHVILNTKHHDKHHQAPHTKAYCITTGHMDHPLRWLAFFPILEWTIETLFRLPPHHKRNQEAVQ